MADKQVQISAVLLEELVIGAQNVAGLARPQTDGEKAEVARLNRAVSSAATILRGSLGPQSFSGNETGHFHIDPTRSQFI